MENLIGISSTENTRTPIQKAQNELNALIAERKKLNNSIGDKTGTVTVRNNTHRKIMRLQQNIQIKIQQINQIKKNQTRKNLLNKGSLDYIIITNSDLKDFQNTVMSKLTEGYTLQGGVSVSERGYSQALIKQKIAKNLLSNNVNLLQL